MFPAFSQFPEGQIIAFALIFLRVISFVIAMPVLGSGNVPAPVKVLLSLTLAVVIFPVLKFQNVDYIKISDQVIFLALREIFVGLFLGYMVRLFFFAINIAGEIIGVSSGLASAQLFNPAMGTQSSVLEQFYTILATLFFFGLNGHHMFLLGFAMSFELVPIADLAIRTTSFADFAVSFQEILLIGLKLSSPILISILLTNLAMGVLGRAVPQMNIFVTSLQVTFMVSMFVLIVTVPFFVEEMEFLLRNMTEHFMNAMKVI
mgnify:CR=1 FL=1